MADDSYLGGAWKSAKSSVQRRTEWMGLYGPKEKSLRTDPLPAFSFLVKLDLGLGQEAEALFQSVSGLQYSTQVVPVGAGGVNNTTYKLVGHTEWPNLVLKQGFTSNSKLILWRQDWLRARGPGGDQTRFKRINGKITLLDTALRPQAFWNFTRGWPCKWDISEFSATKNELSIQTLEIAHDGLTYEATREDIYGGGPPPPAATPDAAATPKKEYPKGALGDAQKEQDRWVGDDGKTLSRPRTDI